MLWKCCTHYGSKFGKLSSGHRTGKDQYSSQSQRKAMPKNAQITTQLHSSHASKVMLKILQARIQQYMNHELPDVQAGFRKGRGTRDQMANISWIIEKAREFQRNICCPVVTKEIKPVHPKGNQSWIFIGRTDAEAEAPCFGYLVQKPDSLEKTLILGKSEDGRRREQQRMSWLDGIINSMDMGLRKLQELVCIDRWPMPLLLFIHWQMLFTSAKL